MATATAEKYAVSEAAARKMLTGMGFVTANTCGIPRLVHKLNLLKTAVALDDVKEPEDEESLTLRTGILDALKEGRKITLSSPEPVPVQPIVVDGDDDDNPNKEFARIKAARAAREDAGAKEPPTLTFDGRKFTHRFHNHFPEVSDATLEDWAVSARERMDSGLTAMREALTLDENDGVIDGWNRLRLLKKMKLGLDQMPDPKVRKGKTTEDNLKLAYVLNLDRRHLTPEQQQDLKEKRIGRVAKMRQEGKTLVQIATEEKVSATQISNDLKEAKERGIPTEPVGGTIKTKDGRTRSPNQKKSKTGKRGSSTPLTPSSGNGKPDWKQSLAAYGQRVRSVSAHLLSLSRKPVGDQDPQRVLDVGKDLAGIVANMEKDYARAEKATT